MSILAIVGTRRFGSGKGLAYARELIRCEVRDPALAWESFATENAWDSFVTGDAPGIDQLVKDICDQFRRPCEVISPANKRWEPEGYKARNILIAEKCDELLCIRDPESTTYGSGWTADYAESLGKPVTRVTIS